MHLEFYNLTFNYRFELKPPSRQKIEDEGCKRANGPSTDVKLLAHFSMFNTSLLHFIH